MWSRRRRVCELGRGGGWGLEEKEECVGLEKEKIRRMNLNNMRSYSRV